MKKRIISIAFIIALLAMTFVPAMPVYAAIEVDEQIGHESDDCRVTWTGAVWNLSLADVTTAGYYNATYQKMGSGLRFQTVAVPQGATITEAHIIFTANSNNTATVVNSRFTGEDVNDAAAFSNIADYQARRGTIVGGANDDYITTAQVDWDGIGSWTVNTEYDSPNIKTIIQEIVDRGGWSSGNDMVIFWDDHDARGTQSDGKNRRAFSYDGSTTKCAKLHIEYIEEPVVSTSAASNVEETSVTLNANITDLKGNSTVYAYFQYSTTGVYEGEEIDTAEQAKTETGTYAHNLEDLDEGATYHFRAALRWNTDQYVYGDDETFDTKPDPPYNISRSTGETTVTIEWTKGDGADKTTIRRSSTAYPANPAAGDAVYDGVGVSVIDTTLVTNQTYYYSMWSKSSADVYSDTYVTFIATPSADVLDIPDELDIIDVKVFANYLEYDDQIYLIRYKIMYDAGDPSQDCSDFFQFELLDGESLLAQVPVNTWGYKPGCIYQSAISAPDWGESYTIKIIGNPIAWGTPPETQWNLTSSDWIGDDRDKFFNWVITSAKALQDATSIEHVVYAATGTVLSDYGGIVFNMGIPGLSGKYPELFSASAEWMGAEPTEHVIDPEGTMTTDNLGDYIYGLLEDGADIFGIETNTYGGLLVVGCYILVAIVLGRFFRSILNGFGLATPVLLFGAFVDLFSAAALFVIVFIFITFIAKAFWLRGV